MPHLIISVAHPFSTTHCCVIYTIVQQAVKSQLNITYCKVICPKANGLMESWGRGVKRHSQNYAKMHFQRKIWMRLDVLEVFPPPAKNSLLGLCYQTLLKSGRVIHQCAQKFPNISTVVWISNPVGNFYDSKQLLFFSYTHHCSVINKFFSPLHFKLIRFYRFFLTLKKKSERGRGENTTKNTISCYKDLTKH